VRRGVPAARTRCWIEAQQGSQGWRSGARFGEMRCRWAARGQKYLRGRARAWRPTRHGRVRVAPASFHAAFKRRLWDARRPAGCEDALSTHSADEAERLFHGIVAKMCGVNSDKRLLDFEHLDS